MASFLYFSHLLEVYQGVWNPHTAPMKLMVVGSSYVPSQSHSKRSDVVADEISLANYVAGGESVDVSCGMAGNLLSITVPDAFWAGPLAAGTLARRGIVYHARGGAASADELFLCLDPTSPPTTNGTTLTFRMNGAITIAVPIGT